ncbi:MAG: hypothetical protein N0C84_00370 [Candidatus Thiodiazotropha taylori]|uniref:Ig-like domain-containing protein n=1 Tax=Candidatus Thiodiazotropha taylori TaxID=2792791 RepID=A0A9E4KAL8_9GAMM|nr:hypothetical protein [Candidatus Thiodiazotropha taylori]MCW4254898.1 hypothetical protein [Candidatus Thiodiazotropha taylori]
MIKSMIKFLTVAAVAITAQTAFAGTRAQELKGQPDSISVDEMWRWTNISRTQFIPYNRIAWSNITKDIGAPNYGPLKDHEGYHIYDRFEAPTMLIEGEWQIYRFTGVTDPNIRTISVYFKLPNNINVTDLEIGLGPTAKRSKSSDLLTGWWYGPDQVTQARIWYPNDCSLWENCQPSIAVRLKNNGEKYSIFGNGSKEMRIKTFIGTSYHDGRDYVNAFNKNYPLDLIDAENNPNRDVPYWDDFVVTEQWGGDVTVSSGYGQWTEWTPEADVEDVELIVQTRERVVTEVEHHSSVHGIEQGECFIEQKGSRDAVGPPDCEGSGTREVLLQEEKKVELGDRTETEEREISNPNFIPDEMDIAVWTDWEFKYVTVPVVESKEEFFSDWSDWSFPENVPTDQQFMKGTRTREVHELLHYSGTTNRDERECVVQVMVRPDEVSPICEGEDFQDTPAAEPYSELGVLLRTDTETDQFENPDYDLPDVAVWSDWKDISETEVTVVNTETVYGEWSEWSIALAPEDQAETTWTSARDVFEVDYFSGTTITQTRECVIDVNVKPDEVLPTCEGAEFQEVAGKEPTSGEPRLVDTETKTETIPNPDFIPDVADTAKWAEWEFHDETTPVLESTTEWFSDWGEWNFKPAGKDQEFREGTRTREVYEMNTYSGTTITQTRECVVQVNVRPDEVLPTCEGEDTREVKGAESYPEMGKLIRTESESAPFENPDFVPDVPDTAEWSEWKFINQSGGEILPVQTSTPALQFGDWSEWETVSAPEDVKETIEFRTRDVFIETTYGDLVDLYSRTCSVTINVREDEVQPVCENNGKIYTDGQREYDPRYTPVDPEFLTWNPEIHAIDEPVEEGYEERDIANPDYRDLPDTVEMVRNASLDTTKNSYGEWSEWALKKAATHEQWTTNQRTRDVFKTTKEAYTCEVTEVIRDKDEVPGTCLFNNEVVEVGETRFIENTSFMYTETSTEGNRNPVLYPNPDYIPVVVWSEWETKVSYSLEMHSLKLVAENENGETQWSDPYAPAEENVDTSVEMIAFLQERELFDKMTYMFEVTDSSRTCVLSPEYEGDAAIEQRAMNDEWTCLDEDGSEYLFGDTDKTKTQEMGLYEFFTQDREGVDYFEIRETTELFENPYYVNVDDEPDTAAWGPWETTSQGEDIFDQTIQTGEMSEWSDFTETGEGEWVRVKQRSFTIVREPVEGESVKQRECVVTVNGITDDPAPTCEGHNIIEIGLFGQWSEFTEIGEGEWTRSKERTLTLKKN